jgi:DNA mismatch endonuclease (patch repair protein)
VPAWRADRATDQQWRGGLGRSRRQGQAEQDHAAGGSSHHRRLTTASGTRATARVVLRRRSGTRRVYAYLMWSHHRTRHEQLLGEVSQLTRSANLQAAWALVRQHQLLTPAGRAAYRTTVTPTERE